MKNIVKVNQVYIRVYYRVPSIIKNKFFYYLIVKISNILFVINSHIKHMYTYFIH